MFTVGFKASGVMRTEGTKLNNTTPIRNNPISDGI